MHLLKLTKSRESTILLLLNVFLHAARPTWAVGQGKRFTRTPLCSGQQWINKGALELKDSVRGVIPCSLVCSKDESCFGLAVDGDGKCYHHKRVLSLYLNSCFREDSFFSYFRRPGTCENKGRWKTAEQACTCVKTWVGRYCERRPRRCIELLNFGYTTGFYWTSIDFNGDESFLPSVYCYINTESKYADMIVIRNNGKQGHNKTWDEYVKGYYIDRYNYFIGLENIVQMNREGCKQFALVAYVNYGRTMLYSYYEHFNLSSAASGYKFSFLKNVQSRSGNSFNNLFFGDCMSPSVGVAFSTWDSDHDGDAQNNCAARAGAGWWFPSCEFTCNPLGWSYVKKPGPRQDYHMLLPGFNVSSWKTSLIFVQVELREQN